MEVLDVSLPRLFPDEFVFSITCCTHVCWSNLDQAHGSPHSLSHLLSRLDCVDSCVLVHNLILSLDQERAVCRIQELTVSVLHLVAADQMFVEAPSHKKTSSEKALALRKLCHRRSPSLPCEWWLTLCSTRLKPSRQVRQMALTESRKDHFQPRQDIFVSMVRRDWRLGQSHRQTGTTCSVSLSCVTYRTCEAVGAKFFSSVGVFRTASCCCICCCCAVAPLVSRRCFFIRVHFFNFVILSHFFIVQFFKFAILSVAMRFRSAALASFFIHPPGQPFAWSHRYSIDFFLGQFCHPGLC